MKYLISITFLCCISISTYGQTTVPQSYFPLNSNALDSMVRANGLVVNNVSFVNDAADNANSAIHFGQGTHFLDLVGSDTAMAFIPGTLVYTISLKVKLSDLTSTQVLLGGGRHYRPGFELIFDGTLGFTLYSHYHSVSGAGGTTTAISDNDWHHIAITGDGHVTRIFVDGQLYALGSNWDYTNRKPSTMTQNLFVGAKNVDGVAQNPTQNATIDELRFYNQTLTAAELSQLASFNSSTPVGATSPVASGGGLWNLNELTGDLYYDSANVSIGSNYSIAGYKLAVKGKIITDGIQVRSYANWPDYVFYNNYPLIPLNEVEAFIKSRGHLPGVPSAKEVASNGLNVEIVMATLLEKIEELTLHSIEMNKRLTKLESVLNEKK